MVFAAALKLPFDLLPPGAFEELCLALVRRSGYEEVGYPGEAGSDGGIDVSARKDGRLVCFQCKRTKRFGFADAEKEIAKLEELKDDVRPTDLVFVLTATVRSDVREKIRKRWVEPSRCSFWASAELDERIRAHPELLEQFFGKEFHERFYGPRRNVLLAPGERIGTFTGRESELAAIAATLTEGQPRTFVLHGLGGIGKTQIAVEYFFRAAQKYHSRLWVVASSASSLETSLLEVARRIGLDRNASAEEILPALARWFRDTDGWLLVLDDLRGFGLWQQFLPVSSGHVLITTRDRGMAIESRIDGAVEVEPFDVATAEKLLWRRVQRRVDGSSAAEAAAARRIAETVGGLPLAIEHAAAFIARMQTSFSRYLSLLEAGRLAVLAKGSIDPEVYRRTWSMNLEQVESESSATMEVLLLSSLLADAPIPLELFVQGAPVLPAIAKAVAEEGMIESVLEPAARFSLLGRGIEQNTFSIHPLVKETLRDRCDADKARQRVKQAVAAMARAFPPYEEAALGAKFLPHVETLAARASELEANTIASLMMIQQAAAFARNQGLTREAVKLYESGIDVAYKVLSPPDPAYGMIGLFLHVTGAYYVLAGRWREAEELLWRAVFVRLFFLDDDLVHTLVSLGRLRLLRGRPDEAEPLLERALELAERQGEAAGGLIPALAALARLSRARGDVEREKALLRRALDIADQTAEGPSFEAALLRCNHLLAGGVPAGEVIPRLLALEQQVEERFGPNDSHVAEVARMASETLLSTGRFEEAVGHGEKAVTALTESFGERHPDIGTTLATVAVAKHKLGLNEDAERDARRAVDVLGEHLRGPVTALADAWETLAAVSNRAEDARAAAAAAASIRLEIKEALVPSAELEREAAENERARGLWSRRIVTVLENLPGQAETRARLTERWRELERTLEEQPEGAMLLARALLADVRFRSFETADRDLLALARRLSELNAIATRHPSNAGVRNVLEEAQTALAGLPGVPPTLRAFHHADTGGS
jgi:tetratricopeptide (TPR) repeat protein